MRLFVALEQRFLAHNGVLYAGAVASYEFWRRYLDVFEQVTIVARIKEVERVPDKWLEATGDRVGYIPLPYYQGFKEFLHKSVQLGRVAGEVAKQDGAFLLRVPGTIGTFLWLHLVRLKKPFALEVVGDAYEALSPKVWNSSWIQPLRILAAWTLKQQCRTAGAGLSYVTKRTLQQRYPPKISRNGRNIPSGIRVFSISDVGQINFFSNRENADLLAGKKFTNHRLVFVGTLDALYKGQEVLLKSVAECIRQGLDIEVELIGEGRYRRMLEDLTRRLGIVESVTFLGQISSREKVLEHLRKASLFVLPSLTEGLPRALLEAMACGLPCIGSTVGGIPEILRPEDMVPPGDVQALTSKIREVLSDPKRMVGMAERNRRIAEEYQLERLQPLRLEFYRQIREETTRWQATKA